jgi:hypothetical protein
MSNAQITVYGQVDRDRIARLASQVPAGTRVWFKASKRTADQNAKLWAMLTDISRQVVWYGQKLTPDDWKSVLTASLRKSRVIPGLDAGTLVPLGMSTSSMSKQEFSDLIELIHAFAAQQGAVLSDHEAVAA